MVKTPNCRKILVQNDILFIVFVKDSGLELEILIEGVLCVKIPFPVEGYLHSIFHTEDFLIINFVKEFYEVNLRLLQVKKIEDILYPTYFKKRNEYLGQVIGGKSLLKRIVNGNEVWSAEVPGSKVYWIFSEKSPMIFGFRHNGNKEASVYKYDNGELLWNKNFQESGKHIRSSDGVVFDGTVIYWEIYEGYLFLELLNGMLITYDLLTGKEFWRIEEHRKDNTSYTRLDKNGYIYRLKPQVCYQKIDVQTGEVVVFKSLLDRSFFNTYGYQFATVKVYGNYFCATEQYKKCVNVFDKDTFELIYQFHLDGAIKPLAAAACPYILDGKLYQIDGDETLHVFDLVKEI